MMRRLVGALVVGVVSAAAGVAHGQPAGGAKIDFNREVRPILSDACFACHGPDEKTRKAKLRLDSKDGLLANGKADATVVPGKAEQSELYKRLVSHDEEERMPPAKAHKRLTAEQIALVKRWIDSGASYEEHWSFVAPEKAPLPAVTKNEWVRNPIDAFVLARQEAAGLSPNPEADRYTLIRRLSLDLTGLPPTVEAVDQFIHDKSPDAYEKLVERVLASKHYGEKMAQHWLDLARFADTSGYHYDSTRQMWIWREYVIDSFNNNKPFSEFTIEQLAGDMLPSATNQQKIASGFNRNTRFNEEGGADPKEFVIRYAVDRANTLGTVWLGMTVECAECHTHKYDPISHKEYYQLYAFFNSIEEPMVSGNHNQPLPPLLKLPTAQQEKELAEAKEQLAATDKQLREALAKFEYVETVSPGEVAATPKPGDFVWVDDELPGGVTPNSWQWAPADAPVKPLSGTKHVRASGPGLQQSFFDVTPRTLTINAGDKLFAYVYLDPDRPPKTIALQWNVNGSWEHRAFWGEDKIPWGGADSDSRRKTGPLPAAGQWVRLEVDPAKVGLKPGAVVRGLAFTQFDGTAYFDKAGAFRQNPPDQRAATSLAVWDHINTKTRPAELPPEIRAALKIEPDKRNDAQKKQIKDYYLRNVHAPAKAIFGPLEAKSKELTDKIKKTEDAIPYSLVSQEMKERRKAFLLIRGDFQQPGEEVQPGVPAIFPPLKVEPGKTATRLDLAKWLVDGQHPTVARVAVNRFWKMMYGTGLSKTMGDLGTQGERPSHPELLDWLAVEFQEKNWDVKHIIRLMVTSATYRQSPVVNPKHMQMDAENRLLWRGTRYRLSAEEVRDNALAISGLLSARVGGPSVNPYQPAGYYNGKFGWKWETSKGEELYRRGLYTFWRRTSLYPTFQMFDAPSREVCTADRARTNTPLQALATMNDPTFVEASRVLAERTIKEGGDTPEKRLNFAFRRTVCRPPTADEMVVLTETFDRQKVIFEKEKKKATDLLTVGEWPLNKELDPVEFATWTAICNVILNLDEAITRE